MNKFLSLLAFLFLLSTASFAQKIISFKAMGHEDEAVQGMSGSTAFYIKIDPLIVPVLAPITSEEVVEPIITPFVAEAGKVMAPLSVSKFPFRSSVPFVCTRAFPMVTPLPN
jgi:hypothetical protein